MSDDIVAQLPTIGLHVLENTLAGVVGVIAAPVEPFVQVVTGQSVSDLARRLEGALVAQWGIDQDEAKQAVAQHPALQPEAQADDNVADEMNAAVLAQVQTSKRRRA